VKLQKRRDVQRQEEDARLNEREHRDRQMNVPENADAHRTPPKPAKPIN
jgi:hypothetical protein